MVPSPFSFTRARLIAKAQRILDAGSFAVRGTPGRAGAGAPARACPASKRANGARRWVGAGVTSCPGVGERTAPLQRCALPRCGPLPDAAHDRQSLLGAPLHARFFGGGARRRPRARPPRHRSALGWVQPAGRGACASLAPLVGSRETETMLLWHANQVFEPLSDYSKTLMNKHCKYVHKRCHAMHFKADIPRKLDWRAICAL